MSMRSTDFNNALVSEDESNRRGTPVCWYNSTSGFGEWLGKQSNKLK